jgi:hypothetical protein
MATIFAPPKEIEVPEFDFKTWREDEEKFIKELKDFCKTQGSGNYRGKELKIQHADSYARYMVFSLKPCHLIHMPLGDAWHSPLVDGLTAKKIKQLIDQDEAWQKAMDEAWKKKQAVNS